MYKNQHHVFYDGENARGFVRLGGGFTIRPGAKATLDTIMTISGGIDLRETGILQLLKNLQLDSNVVLSSSGFINGRGNAILLGGPLTIPSNTIIRIIGDTMIDGQGCELLLAPHAQLIIAGNSTLTLRNIMVRNTRNGISDPFIKIFGSKGKLALDNAELAMANDLNFTEGQIYIHNDVIFSGTSSLIYTSVAPFYVAPHSELLFDIGTTFSFAPATTSQNIFVLQDKTSMLHLNGSTLQTTSSGMRLTKGIFALENKVVLQSNDGGTLLTGTFHPKASQLWGTIAATYAYCMDWNPINKHLAVGGYLVDAVGGFTNQDEVRVYRYTGGSLAPIASKDFVAGVSPLTGRTSVVKWSPDGQYLAVGGSNAGNVGDFTSTDQFRVYKFDGSTLTAVDAKQYGTEVETIDWHTDGTKIAISGSGVVSGGGFANTNPVRIYSFNGTTLTPLTSINVGAGNSLSWRHSGDFIAVGTHGSKTAAELQMLSFNGSSLSFTFSQDFGPSNSSILSVAWNPEGSALSICGQNAASGAGGFNNTHNARLYRFENNKYLVPITSIDFGDECGFTGWSPSGQELVYAGKKDNAGTGPELRMYRYNGSSLEETFTLDYGDSGGVIYGAGWDSTEKHFAVVGKNPDIGFGGFNDINEIRVYDVGFTQTVAYPSVSRSIVFGNSALGSDYDLNVEVLGNAHVIVNAVLVDDSA